MSNNVVLGGSISMSGANVPTRDGQRIATESDIINVPAPFIGEMIYIEDLDKFVYVKSLKSKKIGNFEIKDAVIDEYELLLTSENSSDWIDVV